ncbi:unnamed protein product [Lactuca saligna]|uniref:Uncharacterized protein n=1 Tax=Lactuca saligna TaxID=75948 RepID=A0AA35Y6I9_LACSI|nr:unnamed protein product [Lactuca saligna]
MIKIFKDDDQWKCSGGQGDGSGAHEDNVGKNHVEGKGDVNDHVYEDDIGKNNDLLNEKDDEDDEQGNGTTKVKSVGLIDSHEGVSFSQFICDPVVESFLKTLDQGTVNFGEDDKVIVEKKDGEVEDVEVDLDLGKSIDDFSNKNKDGDGLEIIQLNDSKETQSLKKDKVEGKVEKFFVPVLVLDLVKILKDIVLLMETNVMGFRANYESLYKKTYLHLSVLDSWSHILNHEEKFIDVVNFPLRLFMNVDTVFVLVLRQKHIYFIVINLRKRAFEVIDNGADDADFDYKYGVVFKPLKKFFLRYIKEINHVTANEMADKNLKPSYFGEKVSKWKCGLPKECGSQEKILEKLRMKYAAAILTSEMNTKRDDVLKATYEYQKVDEKIRGKHAYDAQWNIERRLSNFF